MTHQQPGGGGHEPTAGGAPSQPGADADIYHGYRPEGSVPLDVLAAWSSKIAHSAHALATKDGVAANSEHVAVVVHSAMSTYAARELEKGTLSPMEATELRYMQTEESLNGIRIQLPWLFDKIAHRAKIQHRLPQAAHLADTAKWLLGTTKDVTRREKFVASGPLGYIERLWLGKAILNIGVDKPTSPVGYR